MYWNSSYWDHPYSIHKKPKLRRVFIYKKQYTFQKNRQFTLVLFIQNAINFTIRDFSAIFVAGVYIQNAWLFA